MDIKTKFNIEQECWLIQHSRILKVKVIGIKTLTKNFNQRTGDEDIETRVDYIVVTVDNRNNCKNEMTDTPSEWLYATKEDIIANLD